jgi:hypothetical protein
MSWITTRFLAGNSRRTAAHDGADSIEIAMKSAESVAIIAELLGAMGELAAGVSHGETITQYGLHVIFNE